MDPMTASALISTGGNVVSSLIGGKKKGPTYRENLKAESEWTTQNFHNKMQLAKQYKIHPLTMLGAQLPQPSAPVYSGGGGNSMGQNIAQSLAQGASSYFTGKANQKLNDLQLERAQLENELLRSQITSINNPNRAGSAYSNDQEVIQVPKEITAQYRDGTEKGSVAMLQTANYNGKKIRMISQQVAESMENDFVTPNVIAITKTMPDFVKAEGQAIGRKLRNKHLSKIQKTALRKKLDNLIFNALVKYTYNKRK